MSTKSELGPASATKGLGVPAKLPATVKWYSIAKGYGFASLQNDDRDIFLHHSEIADGLALTEGEQILIELGDGERGLFGAKIERIQPAMTARPA